MQEMLLNRAIGWCRPNCHRLQVTAHACHNTVLNCEAGRGETAEQKCNGEGIHAFYELRGLR